jgi:Uma2 family endonuclease
MSSAASKRKVTFADYVAAEDASDVKHQFVDGEVFDMSGGTPVHARLGLAVGRELDNQLAGRPCQPFSSDLRVRTGSLTTYPDCTVVCGKLERDPEDRNTILNPTVIVEVLSDTTERFDRGEKAERYRQIPSLREYVLVNQHRKHLELFRRVPEASDHGWIFVEAGEGGRLELESIGCTLEVDRLYGRILELAD